MPHRGIWTQIGSKILLINLNNLYSPQQQPHLTGSLTHPELPSELVDLFFFVLGGVQSNGEFFFHNIGTNIETKEP